MPGEKSHEAGLGGPHMRGLGLKVGARHALEW